VQVDALELCTLSPGVEPFLLEQDAPAVWQDAMRDATRPRVLVDGPLRDAEKLRDVFD
jgi:hypothetical protein